MGRATQRGYTGETALQWFLSAPPAPENGVMQADEKGFVYYDKAKFHAGFCGDVPEDLAAFMYASHGSFAGKCFITPIPHAAWRDKPTYGCIATEDKSINADIQRAMCC